MSSFGNKCIENITQLLLLPQWEHEILVHIYIDGIFVDELNMCLSCIVERVAL
jgi:hypothetical protein